MNPDDLNQYESQQEDMQGPPWWIIIPFALLGAGTIWAAHWFFTAFKDMVF